MFTKSLILIYLVTVFYAFATAFSCKHTIHMFQLNYYRYDEQFRWFFKNRMQYIGQAMISVLMLIVDLIYFSHVEEMTDPIPWEPPVSSPWIIVKSCILVFMFFLACLVSKPRKAKKPLVQTARVKRLEVTIGILMTAAFVIPFIRYYVMPTANGTPLHESKIYFVLILVYALAPMLVMLANLINKPIEYAIARYYINDAKKILKQMSDLKIIGITGSYGKTSVKYYLTTLLRAKYDVLMTPESYNTPMGIVKTIRTEMKATNEFFVCEMGAKWVGDIKEICDIVHPDHGIITSIGPQHLESMGTLENIMKTKFELADSLPQDGILFLNGEDINIKAHGTNRDAITYGIDDDSKYIATDISLSSRGTTFTVVAPNGERQEYTTKLIGRHNVLNIVGAIAVCHTFGISLAELKGQVRKLECVPHRLELSEKNGATIIDDAYNSNPTGTKMALDALSLFDGYKILVTPGMVELGDKQDELNKEFGKNAAAVADYVVLVGYKQAVPIKAGLIEAGYNERKIFVASNINEALTRVYAMGSEGKKKVILLENDLPDNY